MLLRNSVHVNNKEEKGFPLIPSLSNSLGGFLYVIRLKFVLNFGSDKPTGHERG